MFRVWKSLFLLFPLFFLIPAFLVVLVGLLFLGVLAPAITQSRQGGLGGAYGASSYTSSNLVDVSTIDAALPKIYGGSGTGGQCQGTYGAGNDMIKMDFGWSTSYLNKKWQNYPAYRLCNDHYTWETVTNLPLKQVLQTLQWPSDLLAPQYTSQIVALQPLSSFDPNTQQAQQQVPQQQVNQQDQSTGPCDWVPNLTFVHPHIDICEPLRLLINAGSVTIRGIYQSTTAQINFLWQTPLQPFQDDKASGLLTVWSLSWGIVLTCITAVLAYAGLRSMFGSVVSWMAYAKITELIPRLLFGLLAAYFSKEFFIMLIQANNALAAVFNHTTLDVVMNGHVSGVVNESLQIVYGLMGFGLLIEDIARIAIIYLLFSFSPVLFFFVTLPETQRWAKIAVTAAIVFVFLQAVQSASLDVGGRVLATVLHNTEGQLGFLNLLVSLAILYVTLMLFFSLARMALGTGVSPFASRAFDLSLSAVPTVAGFVGNAAGAYRQARNNLFRLPGPDGNTPGSARPSSGRTSGGTGSSRGQTSVTVGGKPFVSGAPVGSRGNNPGGPDNTGGVGSAGKKGPSGPDNTGGAGGGTGSSGKKGPGGAGSGSSGMPYPALPHASLTTQGNANTSSSRATPSSSTSSGNVTNASPTKKATQWRKTPPAPSKGTSDNV